MYVTDGNLTNHIIKSCAHYRHIIILCIECYDGFPFISHRGKWYQHNVHAAIYSDRKPAQERKGGGLKWHIQLR